MQKYNYFLKENQDYLQLLEVKDHQDRRVLQVNKVKQVNWAIQALMERLGLWESLERLESQV